MGRKRQQPEAQDATEPAAGPRHIWIVGTLLLLASAVFLPVRTFEFVSYDDVEYLSGNPNVNRGLSMSGLRWAIEHAYDFTGGPVTWLSHMADFQVFGPDPGAHHLVSLAIHLANVGLLYWLVVRMDAGIWAAGFVAALFGVHPLHVESVAWISQRKDVLSTFWWLAALHAYLSYRVRPGLGAYSAVGVFHMLGLLSKPMVATLPFTLLLLDVWPLRRFPPGLERRVSVLWRIILEKRLLWVLSLMSLIATFLSQRRAGAISSLSETPPGLRLENTLVSYAAYLRKFVWPADLAAYYPYPDQINVLAVAGSGLLLLLLTAGVVAVFRRAPLLTVGWAWYLGTLVPAIGIVQVGGHAMADRFTYVPAIGIYLAVVGLADLTVRSWKVPPRVLRIAGLVVVVALAAVARQQVWTWRDSRSMWEHAVRVSPNARAYSNLGAALLEQGHTKDGIEAFRTAVDLHPRVPRLRRNFGLALLKAGDAKAAKIQFEEAVRIEPDYAEGHAALADALAEQGDVAAALHHYREAIELDPSVGAPHINLAMTLAQTGRLLEALPYAEAAVRLAPQRSDWRLVYAFLLRDLGRGAEARRELRIVLDQDPGNSQAVRELRELQRQ